MVLFFRLTGMGNAFREKYQLAQVLGHLQSILSEGSGVQLASQHITAHFVRAGRVRPKAATSSHCRAGEGVDDRCTVVLINVLSQNVFTVKAVMYLASGKNLNTTCNTNASHVTRFTRGPGPCDPCTSGGALGT